MWSAGRNELSAMPCWDPSIQLWKPLSTHPFIHSPIQPCISPYVHSSIQLSHQPSNLATHPSSICTKFHLFIHMLSNFILSKSIYLSFNPRIPFIKNFHDRFYPSIHSHEPSFHPSIFLVIHQFIHQSIHPFINDLFQNFFHLCKRRSIHFIYIHLSVHYSTNSIH